MIGSYNLFAASLFDGQVLAPLLTALGFVTIPIVAILTRHQRQMAEILHGRQNNDAVRNELADVKAELGDLRSQLRALKLPPKAETESEALTQRLG